MRVIGPDLALLRELAAETERRMTAVPGTRDVVNPLRLPRIDLELGIDRDKAGLLGIASQDIDRTVRVAVAGHVASTYRDALGDEYDVTLRLPIEGRATLALLDDVRVSSRTTGRSVPLAQIAEPHLVERADRIERLKRERLATVTAYVADGHVTSDVTRAVFAALAALELPPATASRPAAKPRPRRAASAVWVPRCWSRHSASSRCWCSSSAASARR